MSLAPKDMSDILKMFKTSKRAKGTTAFVVVSIGVLFSYQNCVNQKTIETQVKEAVTAPPTNVEVDVALIADCPNGGLSLITYLDSNINGKLDEEETIKNTQNVCNGSDGTNGTNGTNGADGVGAGIVVTQASVAECSAGGIKVTTYSDKNNNGILDSNESINSVSSVCNGSNGVDGADGITSQITATKATTAQCSNGGVVYTISSDIDMPASTVVCNGVDGTNGANGSNGSSSYVSQSVASASQCPTGGTVIETKTDNSEPVYSVICNGAKGETGATGATGAAGSSAYITTSVASPYQCANGGVVISTWTDTSNPATQVVCNGTNGSDGANGSSAYVSTTQASTAQCSSGGDSNNTVK